ncbi:hypothetical protein Asulf_00505 [Archaeoglobus sulfaticallidus PM70-1]|uniref:DUF2551 domain-containing protein n=1 Tax=Archaeoglobus sulfaticallidus PM70-1 TaxID=387631 RepID=N0BC27_9EURY|nr:DUF2551 domain-containing protein [Archaeoglobus sulfaticallidus]AGK60528.1 hypothetical protein Asulf_00505 [Archaeoglobus sulfaticallidus PM70-1]
MSVKDEGVKGEEVKESADVNPKVTKEIEVRLRKYLDRDKKKVRSALLRILLSGKKYTTDEIYEELKASGVDIKMRGVSAMVGLISARLGIVKMELGNKNRYYLKKEYYDLVRRILEEYMIKAEKNED